MPATTAVHRRTPTPGIRTAVVAALATAVALALVAAACQPKGGGGGGTTTTTTTKPPATTTTTKPPTTTSTSTTTTTTAPPASTVDPTHLPVGDGKYSSTPKRGYIQTCQTSFNGGGASTKGDWFNSDGTTWDSTKKRVVDGAVAWPGSFVTSVANGVRSFTGNDLPSTHKTGTFPVSPSDDVYAYDRNPNSISSQALAIKLPASPTVATKTTCIRGEVGVSLTGVAIFDALDAGGRDAVAWEAQDSCQGHPQQFGAYHYHSLTTCLADPGTGQSNLLGYAYDGFGIYGMRGADGRELTNADLDECHGTTSPVMWDGKLVTMYHYVATREYPYTVGCFRGTPLQYSFNG